MRLGGITDRMGGIRSNKIEVERERGIQIGRITIISKEGEVIMCSKYRGDLMTEI